MTTTLRSRAGDLREYIDEVGDLPPEVLLGRIVLYTITDEAVDHTSLENWFAELGLDKGLMPAPIREIDAFKKATSEVDKRSYSLSDGRTAHLLCRDVSSTSDMVVRQITREVKDGRKRRLFYNNAIEATFFRKTRVGGTARIRLAVKQDEVLPEEVGVLRRFAQEIAEAHQKNAVYHDGQKLRSLVRNYLLHLNAIEIKGGVYFIHASRDVELAALNELVNRFGGGCSMNLIPIVDLQGQRQFITSVFEREASESLQKITKDAQELIKSARVTPAAVAKIQSEYDQVLAKATEHMSSLQVTQDITAASAEVALNALSKLAMRVSPEAGAA